MPPPSLPPSHSGRISQRKGKRKEEENVREDEGMYVEGNNRDENHSRPSPPSPHTKKITHAPSLPPHQKITHAPPPATQKIHSRPLPLPPNQKITHVPPPSSLSPTPKNHSPPPYLPPSPHTRKSSRSLQPLPPLPTPEKFQLTPPPPSPSFPPSPLPPSSQFQNLFFFRKVLEQHSDRENGKLEHRAPSSCALDLVPGDGFRPTAQPPTGLFGRRGRRGAGRGSLRKNVRGVGRRSLAPLSLASSLLLRSSFPSLSTLFSPFSCSLSFLSFYSFFTFLLLLFLFLSSCFFSSLFFSPSRFSPYLSPSSPLFLPFPSVSPLSPFPLFFSSFFLSHLFLHLPSIFFPLSFPICCFPSPLLFPPLSFSPPLLSLLLPSLPMSFSSPFPFPSSLF
ncbi:hypothetical protein C7M84_011267 [Penaeus vannamei]|uniref:Uncharacterized protein n=1 Tax=Penaeus vannamei TaxID=6689 RepID=A0A423T2F4_PENVA|nr:hypothetical protein C7M84_011267 [Penaeus vannamei]